MEKMAGKQLSWLTLVVMSTAAGLQLKGCKNGDGDDTATGVDSSTLVAEVISGVGPNVVLPALNDFNNSLTELQAAVTAWSDSIGSAGDVPTAVAAVQEKWTAAMRYWQRLEVMQIGPAGDPLNTISGSGLRDEIYSWPTVNRCRIDQKTATGQYLEADFIEKNLVNAYGLDAIEHLIFTSDDSVCNPAVPPISDGSWDAMGQEGVWAARANFTTVLTEHLIATTTDLITTWDPAGGDFSGAVARSSAEEIYTSDEEALDAIYDAFFYLETDTKDRKLAQPLGERDECESEICPEDLEGLISGQTLEMLHANLEGFEAIFTGGEGTGFDDLLRDVDHGDLADSMLANLQAVKTAVETFEGSLYDAIVNGDTSANDLLETFSKLTAEIKWDVATVLSLTVPEEAKADND